MAYRLSRRDDSVQDAVRRIVREQVHEVVGRIDDPAGDRERTVHEVRKTCKKLRALLRLVRPVLPHYRREDAALRDIGRRVSMVRDASVLVGSFDRIVAAYGAQLDREATQAVRERLARERDAMMVTAGIAEGLAACRTGLLALEWRSCDWMLDDDGADALQPGLRKAYRKARHAMSVARDAPTPEHLHAWRKRAKDHWYHARLFTPAWKAPMEAWAKAAHDLGDQLGDHHDLTVFLAALAQRPDAFGTDADCDVLAGLARSLRDALQAQAFSGGSRLFAGSPKALADSWIARYDAWCREGSAHDAAAARGRG